MSSGREIIRGGVAWGGTFKRKPVGRLLAKKKTGHYCRVMVGPGDQPRRDGLVHSWNCAVPPTLTVELDMEKIGKKLWLLARTESARNA